MIHLVVTGDWAWGKGHSLEDAFREARKAGSRITLKGRGPEHVAYEFDEDSIEYDSLFVDDMGRVTWIRKPGVERDTEIVSKALVDNGRRIDLLAAGARS
jgi:hypothetical protein